VDKARFETPKDPWKGARSPAVHDITGLFVKLVPVLSITKGDNGSFAFASTIPTYIGQLSRTHGQLASPLVSGTIAMKIGFVALVIVSQVSIASAWMGRQVVENNLVSGRRSEEEMMDGLGESQRRSLEYC
jgi:hypothetical protein